MRPVDIMPARTAWPQHSPRIVEIPHPMYAGKTARRTLAPWRWCWGCHHMLARKLLGVDTRPVARLWINGAGEDHEIRFEAHPPRPSGTFRDRQADQAPFEWAPDQLPIHGANNSYMHVPGLVLTSGNIVSCRGISYFKTSDVLEVMAWMDGLLDFWYPAVPR